MYIFKVNKNKGAIIHMNLINQSKNPYAFKEVSDNETTIAMVIWLLSFFTSFLGPLIIWAIKREDSAFIDQQGKNYLNFLISYLIYTVIAAILVFLLIGVLLLFILSIVIVVYSIIAIVFVLKGQDYVVPFTIEIIK